MKITKAILILVGMHLIGSAILFGYTSGPSYMPAAPILGTFGWFFIPLEAIGLFLIWRLYQPFIDQSKIRTSSFGFLFGIFGALIASPLIPKEQNNELSYWIGGLLAGLGTAFFSFACIHKIKMSKIAKTEQKH